MMDEIAKAVGYMKVLDESIGIIRKLVGKLRAEPDLAALKLIQALEEVAKTLQAVDNAASKFLCLGIDEGALVKNSEFLTNLDSRGLSTEVGRGRGHCHEIQLIYAKYLDKWFDRTFNSEELASIRKVFGELGDADSYLFRNLEEVVTLLQHEAGVVLDLVLKNDPANARKRVLSVLPTLTPLRQTISKTMQSLYYLKGEFVGIADSV